MVENKVVERNVKPTLLRKGETLFRTMSIIYCLIFKGKTNRSLLLIKLLESSEKVMRIQLKNITVINHI